MERYQNAAMSTRGIFQYCTVFTISNQLLCIYSLSSYSLSYPATVGQSTELDPNDGSPMCIPNDAVIYVYRHICASIHIQLNNLMKFESSKVFEVVGRHMVRQQEKAHSFLVIYQ